MTNSLFDTSFLETYNKCPDANTLYIKTQELENIVTDILSNYHSFEDNMSDIKHGEIVALKKDVIRLEKNLVLLIKKFESEYRT